MAWTPLFLLYTSFFVFYSPSTHLDVCARGKHTQLPFNSASNNSTFIFKHIYCEIWRGYPTPSNRGAHYFLTIVKDYFCATWVYLMCFKYETLQNLEFVFAMVYMQFQCKIHHIRIDNGQ